MPNLIQENFQSYLLDPLLPEEESTIYHSIATSGLVSPITGLKIYFNAYRLRLIEILANDYPKLKAFIKEEKFTSMAIAYIEAYPSQYFSVRDFGRHFSYFLETHTTYSKKPYLSEMAHFEWALGDSLDAEDDSIVTLESLKEIPPIKWSDLKFSFHPSFQIIKLDWNVPQIWQAMENQEKILPRFRKTKKPVTWIIVRSNLQSSFRSSEDNEAYILELARQHISFGEICEKLADRLPEEEVPKFALSCLQIWIKNGLISTFIF